MTSSTPVLTTRDWAGCRLETVLRDEAGRLFVETSRPFHRRELKRHVGWSGHGAFCRRHGVAVETNDAFLLDLLAGGTTRHRYTEKKVGEPQPFFRPTDRQSLRAEMQMQSNASALQEMARELESLDLDLAHRSHAAAATVRRWIDDET